MTYKGRFTPKNISKYEGNPMRIQYRSLWERQTFRWLDANDHVSKWCSEEVIVPYICRTDNRKHLYYPDLKVTFKNGSTYLIEIKPKKETIEPKRKARTKAFLLEVMTYAKNISKWEAASKFAKDKGWTFEVWHEDTLKSLGIVLMLKESKRKTK